MCKWRFTRSKYVLIWDKYSQLRLWWRCDRALLLWTWTSISSPEIVRLSLPSPSYSETGPDRAVTPTTKLSFNHPNCLSAELKCSMKENCLIYSILMVMMAIIQSFLTLLNAQECHWPDAPVMWDWWSAGRALLLRTQPQRSPPPSGSLWPTSGSPSDPR